MRLMLIPLLVWSMSLVAAEVEPALQGDKSIFLVDQDGKLLRIGSLNFRPDTDGSHYALRIESPEFRDQFLSMRPFRCIDAPKERICHQPYPYALARTVSEADLSALEYDLLFLFQTPDQYNSVDAWNGLYYRLRLSNDGLEGELQAVDLNLIMAPPEAGEKRPIKPTDLTPLASDTHTYPRLLIR